MKLLLLAVLAFLLLAARGGDPLHLASENYQQVPSQNMICIGEDEFIRFTASGELSAGESFAFFPQLPMCYQLRVIKVWASWSEGKPGSAPLTVSIDVPATGEHVEATASPEKGKHYGPDVEVCLLLPFHPPTRDLYPTYWTATVENIGDRMAKGITFSGVQANQSRYDDWCQLISNS